MDVPPLLRDLGNAIAPLVDLVFMIHNFALHFHVLGTCEMHFEVLAKWRDQSFLNNSQHKGFDMLHQSALARLCVSSRMSEDRSHKEMHSEQ